MARKINISPLPDDRQVTGADIRALATAYDYQMLDMMWLLGSPGSVYHMMISESITSAGRKRAQAKPGIDSPVADPTRSLLVRYLTRHPAATPVPEMASPVDIHELIRQTPGMESFSVRQLGPMLGCEVGSGYRWLAGEGTSAALARYVTIIRNALASLSPEDRFSVVQEFIEIAETEAAARGMKDPKQLWDKGLWPRSPDPVVAPETGFAEDD